MPCWILREEGRMYVRISTGLICLLLAWPSCIVPATGEMPEPSRPHIILVMADDQGWGDAGYQGHPFVQTPALDAMAENGFVFDRFYAAAPVCSPTRASVMTGRHPFRTRVTNHGRYMRPQEQTLGETFQAAGYVTGMFGKFHLGSGQADSPCNPGAMGFDEWAVGLNFFDDDPYLSRAGKVEPRIGKGSVLLMDDTIDFLHRHKDGERPMLVVVWFPSPHDPHTETPEGPSLYDDRDHAGYYREITLLDQQVGRLRRALRTLEIADDTILWYCSDNGGLVPDTSGGRAKKGSVYEGGLRVPGIVEWPARHLQGWTAAPVTTSDLLPTLMTMAGVEEDLAHPIDGEDISGLFWGTTERRSQPIGFWHHFEAGQGTRSDAILKAILEKQEAGASPPHDPPRMRKDVEDIPQYPVDTAVGHAAWNDWPFKLHRIGGERIELYHLEDDPMETNDLSGDPQYGTLIARMETELGAWMRSVVRSLNGEDYRNGASGERR
ncbi:MAG: sulfatase-like hydrolase/transferase [Planctomycetota bacterium]